MTENNASESKGPRGRSPSVGKTLGLFTIRLSEIADPDEDWENGRPRPRFWANFLYTFLQKFIGWGVGIFLAKWIMN